MKRRKLFFGTVAFLLMMGLALKVPLPAWGQECVPDPIVDDSGDLAFDLRAAAICIIGRLVNVFIGLVLPVATALLIYGGYRVMSSGGDPRSLESTKKFITWVILGAVLALGVFLIIDTIIGYI
jgi:hypothetical protein